MSKHERFLQILEDNGCELPLNLQFSGSSLEDVARYAITRGELTCMDIQNHFSICQSRAMKLFKMLHCFSVTEKPDSHGVSAVKCKDEQSLKSLLVLARQTERATAKFLAYFESTGNLHS